jgi:hypothetical protein
MEENCFFSLYSKWIELFNAFGRSFRFGRYLNFTKKNMIPTISPRQNKINYQLNIQPQEKFPSWGGEITPLGTYCSLK